MRVLVTGIRGAAGSYLAEYLRGNGVDVHGIARPECDLLDAAAVRDRLVTIKPQVIYHLASDADVRQSFDSPAQCFGNNTLGTVNLFESVRAARIDPVVVLCSSSEVYGNPTEWPIGESWPLAPANPYAVSKAAQDLLAQMYARCYGVRVVITRAFGYINPRRDDLSISSFARQVVAIERGKQREILHGNLDSIRTFCDVRDIVRAYELAATLPGVKGGHWTGIYNIGASDRFSIGQVLRTLVSMARAPIRTRVDPALLRPVDVTNQVPDCQRFTSATGWAPQIGIKESLSWLLDHYRDQAPVEAAA